MMVKLYLYLIFGYMYHSNALEVSISPLNPYVIEGGNIKLTLKTSPFIQFDSCKIISPESGEYIRNDTCIIDNMENCLNIRDGIRWLPQPECGVLLTGISKISEGIWWISGFNATNEYKKFTRVQIISLPQSKETVSVFFGNSAIIDCLTAPIRPRFCRIIDNNGELVSQSCRMTIDPVKMEHEGNWICKFGLMGSMDEATHVIELQIKSSEKLLATYTKTESSVELVCILEGSTLTFNWCRAVSPNGTYFMLDEGLLLDRYSSFKTDVSKRQCSLEIKLPLNEATDNGRWRIDIGRDSEDFTGCFFTLPDVTQTIQPVPSIEEKEVFLSVGTSYTMQCSVPWPIDYCYVRQPDGKLLYPIGTAMMRMLKAGYCSVKVDVANTAISGKWACVVSSQDFSEDISYNTKINVIDSEIVPTEDRVISYSGKSAIVMCKSPFQRPMKYCRFVSPTGKGYSLRPDSNTNSRYVYWGKGLEYGECGMLIKIIRMEDEGNWTCATSLVSSILTEERSFIYVGGPEPGVAFIIGISIGGIILLVLFIIFFMYRKQLKCLHNNRYPQENVSYPVTRHNISDDNNSL